MRDHTIRTYALSMCGCLLCGIGIAPRASAQAARDSILCTPSDTIYTVADTVRGVRPPKGKSTPRIYLKEVGTGATQATIIVETNGRVTVEGFQQLGDHGMRERGEVTSGLGRWRFVPATLDQCPVRFRTSMAVQSVGR